MRRRNKQPGREAGFVLIEALIAILILSVGLAALVQAARESVKATQTRVYGFIPAQELADRLMAQFELAAIDSAASESQPLSGEEGSFRYRVELTEWPANPALKKVDVTVSWAGPRKPGSVTLTTLLPKRPLKE